MFPSLLSFCLPPVCDRMIVHVNVEIYLSSLCFCFALNIFMKTAEKLSENSWNCVKILWEQLNCGVQFLTGVNTLEQQSWLWFRAAWFHNIVSWMTSWAGAVHISLFWPDDDDGSLGEDCHKQKTAEGFQALKPLIQILTTPASDISDWLMGFTGLLLLAAGDMVVQQLHVRLMLHLLCGGKTIEGSFC